MTSLLFKVPNNWFPHTLNLCAREERTTSLQRIQQLNSSLSSTGIYGTATTTRYYHLNIGGQYMNPGMQYVTAHASCFTASLTAHLLGAPSRIRNSASRMDSFILDWYSFIQDWDSCIQDWDSCIQVWDNVAGNHLVHQIT